jgi:hypothetical protein
MTEESELVAPDLVADGAGWTLIVDRTLRQTPDQVWAALTQADQLRIWGPFSSSRDLVSAGPVQLTDLGVAAPSTTEAFVQQAVSPSQRARPRIPRPYDGYALLLGRTALADQDAR